MSTAERVRELARQMKAEVSAIERRKIRTANEAERKVLDLIAAQNATEDAASAAVFFPEYRRVTRITDEARRAVGDTVRDVAGGRFARDVAPVILAYGLALGLTDLVRSEDEPMFSAAINLQCAAFSRLQQWARTVEREGGVRDGY